MFSEERVPFAIGSGSLAEVAIGTNINSLPIKFPGTEYRIPAELSGIRQLLETCVAFNRTVDHTEGSRYVYLSLQRTYTTPGRKQRSEKIHVDGIQGPRIQPKVEVEHGYVMVDRDPTIFFPGPIDMSNIDVDVHDMEQVFAQRVDRGRSMSFPVGTIAMIDGCCVHEAIASSQAGPRGFFRLLYAARPYDRIGNSFNALFSEDYEKQGWQFQTRQMPTNLLPPPSRPSQHRLNDPTSDA